MPEVKPDIATALAAYLGTADQSGTQLTDYSGNDLHGTLQSSGSWSSVSGHNSRYSLTVGGSQYGQVPTTAGNLVYSLPLSVSAWLKPSSYTGFQNYVAGNRNASNHGFQIRTTDTKIQIVFYVPVSTVDFSISPSPSVDEWHHLVVVFTSSGTDVFWDGASLGSTGTVMTPCGGTNEPMGLWAVDSSGAMASFSTGAASLEGADLIFWDAELSTDEISWLANPANNLLASVVPPRNFGRAFNRAFSRGVL